MPTCSSVAVEKTVPRYQGGVRAADELGKYLERKLATELRGAYVHGSIATGEEIAYSDFDALVIIKNAVFESDQRLAKTAFHLITALRYLHLFDPLQHHGFFVVVEGDLDQYCDAYFPVVLFDHAKSLLSNGDDRLRICCRNSEAEATESLVSMLASLQQKLEQNRLPKNYYDLKLLLSQVMLMPSLYLQHLGQPVSKKESFAIARQDFSSDVWRIMDEISQIRLDWDYRPSRLLNCGQRVIFNPFLNGIYQKKAGRRISSKIRRKLTDNFYARIMRFVRQMRFCAGLEHRTGAAS
jgi:hypothetical protein